MKKIVSGLLLLAILFTVTGACWSCESISDSEKKITGVNDLDNARIGVQLGTTGDIYSSDCEVRGAQVERYNKGADAVLALTQGKIDCVIIDSEPAKSFVASNKGLKILDEPFVEEEYAICVAKENNTLRDQIDEVLSGLKNDGVIDKIIKNYIGDDTKGTCPYETPSGVSASKGELHMATNAFFEPYEYYEGDKIVGIDIMIAQAICDRLGYKLVVDDMDFDAIITAIQSGKADFGMAGITANDERKNSINFTSSYTRAKQVIIVKD